VTRIAAALAALAAACGADNGPHLDTVTPTTLAAGQTFTLAGSRLCQASTVNADGTCPDGIPGDVEIDIDYEAKAPVTTWTDTMIVATLPGDSPHGATTVFVRSHGNASNALDITVP
jgi:uncharacterized protein (TIGR03437 family)